jgi:mannose-6-phosphate isomerase-like protein (cupin superfamily)
LEDDMKAFDCDVLLSAHARAGESYLEFLREGYFSGGLYVLPAGADDPQVPHGEDEVYYVLRGAASFETEGHSQPIHSGSILYVPAHAPHRFHSIQEELAVLVFFAPPESGA